MPLSNSLITVVDSSGNAIVVPVAAAVPAGGLMVMGSDGTNARFLSTDTSGRLVVIGQGVAGTPAGGVMSIQGVAGGTAIPISGSITATNPSVGTTGSAIPTSSTLIGGSDGTNLVALKVKPASTAAVAADPSLVVALSPNTPAKIWDGTNTAAVKAASTAAVAADPALVVAISPNNKVGVVSQVANNASSTGIVYLPVGGLCDTGNINALGITAGGNLKVAMASQAQLVQSAVTITTSGTNGNNTAIYSNTVTFEIDVAGPVTGAGATLVFTLREMAGDGTTVAQSTSVSITAVGVYYLTLNNLRGYVSTTWTVSGTTPSFGGVTTYYTQNPSLIVNGTGTIGQKAPTDAFMMGASDGTNLQGLRVKPASTAAVATDPALVVAISPNNPISVSGTADATATGALGALNAAVQIAAAGLYTVGLQLAAGTLIGTLVPEVSFDGGTTWNPTYFDTPSSQKVASITYASNNTAAAAAITAVGGAGLYRVRVSAYTSGTANVTLRATTAGSNTNMFEGPSGQAAPLSTALVGGSDGTNLVSARMKAASTAAVATDPSLVVAISPNTPAKVWDGTNTAAVKAASTAAVATDPALVVAISPNNPIVTSAADVTTSGALGALNAAVQVVTAGLMTAGFQLAAGTLIGTIVPEVSFDGGTTWTATYFDTSTSGKVASIVFASSNAATAATIVGVGGSGISRVRVSAYTSGTANVTVRATTRTDPSVLFAGPPGTVVPPSAALIGGTDGTTLRGILTDTSGRAIVLGYTQAVSSNYPDPSQYLAGYAPTNTDAYGNLQVRSTILTDEGSLRDDFPGASLTTAIGTPTFTNGSTAVTGTGFALTYGVTSQNYIKRDSDGTTAWAPVASINSDTSITLASAYTGTTGSSASSMTRWPSTTASGGTVTVTGGSLVLATGTTSAATAYVFRQGDSLPFQARFYNVAWSQSIANQQAVFGVADQWPTPNHAAYVQFTGTNNTLVNFVTQYGPGATEIQTQQFTLPYGVTAATPMLVEIDVEADVCTLLINGQVIGSNNVHIPSPYDNLGVIAYANNTGAAASTTSLTIDGIFFQNTDQIEIKDSFDGTPNAVTLSGENNVVCGTGSDERLAVGVDTFVFLDDIAGSTLNGNLWGTSVLTQTVTQTTGVITLNAGAITTVNTYSILFSDKYCYISVEHALDFAMRARIVYPAANATLEWGFGTVATNTAPTDGAFFRISAAGVLTGVINFNGTEISTNPLGSLTTTKYYNFNIRIVEDVVSFEANNADDSTVLQANLAIPATQGSVTNVSRQQVFARVINTASLPASAPQILISYVSVQQQDVATNKDWASQMSGIGRSAIYDPATFAQSLQLAAGAAPTAGAPTNTACRYATLGGEFVNTSTASSENLLGVFGYQIPIPFNFVLTDVLFQNPVVSVAMGATTPSIHEYALMLNASSNNPSTATGARIPLGQFSVAASAAVATVFNGQPINFSPRTPFTIFGGQFVLVLVKVISGTTTGQYRGSILLNGYWE